MASILAKVQPLAAESSALGRAALTAARASVPMAEAGTRKAWRTWEVFAGVFCGGGVTKGRAMEE